MSTRYPIRRHGTWRTYKPVDGLAGLRVVHITEDAGGDLWLATTTNGVSRFDGVDFRTYTRRDGLSGDEVTFAHCDRSGRLWFGCNGGVCWYDGTAFHPLHPEIWGADVDIVHIAEDRRGRIWFAGYAHRPGRPAVVGCLDGDQLHELSAAQARDCGDTLGLCWGIAQDDAGDLWFARGQLVRYDGRRFHTYGPEQGLPRRDLNALAAAPDGGPLWVGGRNALGRFDGSAWTPAAAPIAGYVRKIQVDRHDRVWVCDSESGVLCFTGDEVQRLVLPTALGDDAISGVHLGREGHLWLASWGGGVLCYDETIQHIGVAEGLPGASVSALAADRAGRLWMGFGSVSGPEAKRLACWDGDSLAVLGAEQGIDTTDCVACCIDEAGCLWLGDWCGLLRNEGCRPHDEGAGWQRLGPDDGFHGGRVYSLHAGSAGRLLIGHGDAHTMGISVWDGATCTPLWSSPRAMHQYVSALLERDGGDLWFGIGGLGGQGQGQGPGIARLHSDGTTTWYGVEAGLPDSRVEDLCDAGNGALWVATVGGLARFDNGSFTCFTTEDGLPSNYIHCLHLDGGGHLWLGGDGGVTRFDGRVFQTVHAEPLGPTRRIVCDPQGALWCATDGGLVAYRPATEPPRIRIRQVIADRVYAGVDAVEVPSASRHVAIEFQGLSFRTRPEHMLYACRLHGLEADWQPPTRQLRVAYRDLPAGDYRFEVKAIDRDLNVSAPAGIAIRVLPDTRTEGLAAALTEAAGASQFIGSSAALRRVEAQLAQVAATDLSVLILGETGAGKGLAARRIHQLSRRARAPLIQVNCGAIADSLVESELFGHEKGAFTGAAARRQGRVELAEGGTLFLDEIGDLPLGAQVKLLQFLQDHTFMRVGGSAQLEVDVRIIAATNRDLEQMIAARTFREDLYFRLRIFPVQLPALRERVADIPVLAQYFAERFARHLDRPTPAFSAAALARLQAYPWPGNVRELEHHIQRVVLLCTGDVLDVADVEVGPAALPAGPTAAAPTATEDIVCLEVQRRQHEAEERALIERALLASGWQVYGEEGAARRLGIDPERLRYWMRKHGLRRPG